MCAATGHFDELRGTAAPVCGARLTPAWTQFFGAVRSLSATALNQRALSLRQPVSADGSTDELAQQRPWSLNLFPLLIQPDDWQQMEAGVRQRMRLLERVVQDVYGAQELLKLDWLPPALVQGHPGYLRAMHRALPAGRTHLHMAAFDLARGPDGRWVLLAQHCQAPAGLGRRVQNRAAIAQQFPQALQALQVQPVAPAYRALLDNLQRCSPAGAASHVALLTPGPFNENYDEHAALARYLGLTLVEGCDLIVRDEQLYLKTLTGLVQVHALLTMVEDEYLDPLELRADSTLGVAGLLQAMRLGNVLLANAPGSALLESPALGAFLPALARHLLGEELQLPSPPTWWCGERGAMQQAWDALRYGVVLPTYPDALADDGFTSRSGQLVAEQDVALWAGRIQRRGEQYTVQARVPLSHMPVWPGAGTSEQVGTRPFKLRIYAVADGPHSWRVLPGGVAQLSGAAADLAGSDDGGNADVWTVARGEAGSGMAPTPRETTGALAPHRPLVKRRAAQSLFWLGRNTERAASAACLAQLTLRCLHTQQPASAPLLAWLDKMALANSLVLHGVAPLPQGRSALEHSLISGLAGRQGATSVGYHLRALRIAAASVRERLSLQQWQTIVHTEEQLSAHPTNHDPAHGPSVQQALQLLRQISDQLAVIASAQAQCTDRDDGWRLLDVGRLLERLAFLANALLDGLHTGSLHNRDGVTALLELFGSQIPLDAPLMPDHALSGLIKAALLDHHLPRSLRCVAGALRSTLLELTGGDSNQLGAVLSRLTEPAQWELTRLCESRPDGSAHGHYFALSELLLLCSDAAIQVAQYINARYFSAAAQTQPNLGQS